MGLKVLGFKKRFLWVARGLCVCFFLETVFGKVFVSNLARWWRPFCL